MPPVLDYATPEKRGPNPLLKSWATGLAALPLVVGLGSFFLCLANWAAAPGAVSIDDVPGALTPALVGLVTLVYGGVFLLAALVLVIIYAVKARRCGWAWRIILRKLRVVITLLLAFYPVGIGCAAVLAWIIPL